MKVTIYTLNAFTKDNHGGNAAGVVLGADLLTEFEMQALAEKVGFSETAFILNSNNANHRIRFFTPTGEVDLCGHATVASYSAMMQLGVLKNGTYTMETLAGIMTINLETDMLVMSEQRLPDFNAIVDKEIIAHSLNIPVDYISKDLPIQIVSTGLKDIIVPIKSISIMDSIDPDYEQITKISKRYEVTGYHLFALGSDEEAIAYCRNFAPLYGIDEESATGTSNGALACYLYQYSLIAKQKVYNNRFIIGQGYSMQKASAIFVELRVIGEQIKQIQVGGYASTVKEIYVYI